MTELVCTKCKNMKSENNFTVNVKYKRGRSNWCKECHKIAVIDYALRNPEKIKLRNRVSREKSCKEKTKLYQSEYHKRNRLIVNAKRRVYVSLNKDIISSVDYKARAVRKNGIVKESEKVTPKFLRKLKKSTIFCEICGILQYDKKFDLDHILPLSLNGKHVIENLRYICFSCNRKRPKDASDLIGTKHEHLLKT